MAHLEFPIRGDRLSFSVKLRERVFERTTEFQKIEIVDTEVFGRVLLLDGHIQLTEFDERAYHEALVQVPLLSLADPRSALVIGGGDGGVVREICRHGSIERVDMVEIDEGVIEACREHLPSLHAGAFDDPRVHVHIADAFEYVKRCGRRYDLIVADSTDVYEGEDGALSERLFTDTFFEDCREALAEGGLLVTQADNVVFCPYSLEEILAIFGRVFANSGSYLGLVPSFGGYSGFAWASGGASPSPTWPGGRGLDLRYLAPETWGLAFAGARFS
ncbi:MAG: hypothetical protein M9921_07690 [Fimbriimonadaceae bacterium]|nr:hypothetical protein [Fimbriimonadaceae bacterium]